MEPNQDIIYIEVAYCLKNKKEHIRNICIKKKPFTIMVIATKDASYDEIMKAVNSYAKDKNISLRNTIYKVCDKGLEKPESKNLEIERIPFRRRILTEYLHLECPICSCHFPNLFKAIGHAKLKHPANHNLLVLLYKAAYEEYLRRTDTSKWDRQFAHNLLDKTCQILEDIKKRNKEKEHLTKERIEKKHRAIPNSWDNILSQKSVNTNGINIINAGRVDSKRSKH